MVEKILDEFAVAIYKLNGDAKNAFLLAVENRQPHVYNLLLDRRIIRVSVFRQVDNLAAQLAKHRPWLIPGISAPQMQ
ncbi:hypothetical protein TIFTF001_038765 [Ficus carica]|uniref:Uncharacterized protein n=1 Tax=Ficus carica TaxID=3494 RepID=A0AA88E9H5_FICCA|nr:hypothetical protein TIFTF001_038765 [Ficus carica]